MGRYKGRMPRWRIERDFPHSVVIPVPGAGLGRQLDRMHAWAAGKDYVTLGGIDQMRFCFRTAEDAAAFASIFRPERGGSTARENPRCRKDAAG